LYFGLLLRFLGLHVSELGLMCFIVLVTLSGINQLLILQQDSFYHNLTEEELIRVQDYNFDHPGKFNLKVTLSLLISDLLFTLRYYIESGLIVPYR